MDDVVGRESVRGEEEVSMSILFEVLGWVAYGLAVWNPRNVDTAPGKAAE